MKTQQTKNLGCMKDGLEYFVADKDGNRLSEPFQTSDDVYAEIRSRNSHKSGKCVFVQAGRSPQIESAPAKAQGNTHSPLPWTRADEQILSDDLNDYGNFNVCVVKRDGELTAQDRANLAFIVLACNSAQRLADALREALAFIDDGEGGEREAKQAREALAQWEASK